MSTIQSLTIKIEDTAIKKKNSFIIQSLTIKSQIRISPAKQPEARISSETGLNARHHGVRGWPVSMCVHLPVRTSETRTVWSPWVEATRNLQKQDHESKKMSVILYFLHADFSHETKLFIFKALIQKKNLKRNYLCYKDRTILTMKKLLHDTSSDTHEQILQNLDK